MTTKILAVANDWDGKLHLLWAIAVGIAFGAGWLLRRALRNIATPRRGLDEVDILRRAGAI